MPPVISGYNATSSGMTAQAVLTKNVRSLLELTGRSQAELAQYLKLSQPYISLLLSGQRLWQVDMLDALAAFFCTTVPRLFVDGEQSHERRCGVDRRIHAERRRFGNTTPGRAAPPHSMTKEQCRQHGPDCHCGNHAQDSGRPQL